MKFDYLLFDIRLLLHERSTSLYVQILYVTAHVSVESARGPPLKLSFLLVSFFVIVLSRMGCKVISDWGTMLRIMRYFIRENYEKNGEETDLRSFRWNHLVGHLVKPLEPSRHGTTMNESYRSSSEIVFKPAVMFFRIVSASSERCSLSVASWA